MEIMEIMGTVDTIIEKRPHKNEKLLGKIVEYLKKRDPDFLNEVLPEDRPLEDVREEMIEDVREECSRLIFSVINIYHQVDVALGIIPDLGYTTWIAAMITESNRCEDLYAAADKIADMRAVTWNFPTYTGGE